MEAENRPKTAMIPQIRQGEPRDLNRLVEIYNHYVSETHITFDTEPFAVGARTQWFTQFAGPDPTVCWLPTSTARLSAMHRARRSNPSRRTVRRSRQPSIWIKNSSAADTASSYMATCCRDYEASVHRAYAGVALPNPGSVALHQKLGFVHVASYHEVGYKFGEYWDVDWFEKDVS